MDKLIWADEAVQAPETLIVSSDAFADGGLIPVAYTEDGAGVSPPIAWHGAPPTAVCAILVVEDADSPTPEPIVHALVFGLPANDQLAEASLPGKVGDGAVRSLGRNSFGKARWLPPDPPTGHGPHRYVFQVYALDQDPRLHGEPSKHDVEKALRGRVVARGRLTGVYGRPD